MYNVYVMQLEAANRQLRSTRKFVEEQEAEREAERDEFAARLRDLRDDNERLAARLATNARILAEVGPSLSLAPSHAARRAGQSTSHTKA